MMGAGFKPSEATAELLHAQPSGFQIDAIGVGDLELATRRWFEFARYVDDRCVVKIESGHRPIRFRLLWLLFNTNWSIFSIELEDAVPLWVIYAMREHGGLALA